MTGPGGHDPPWPWMFCGRIDLKGTFMKNRLILSTATALLALALPANAGVSIDRASPSIGGCPFAVSPAQVFNLVPPGGGCDVFGVGPVLEVMPPAMGLVPMDNIDALSANTLTPETLSYYLVFSGSRGSVGMAGTPYSVEAVNNQAASDLWRTLITSASPAASMAACAPVAIAAPHFLHRNQTGFNLARTAAPGVAVAAGQDNIDAVELDVLDFTGDDVHDVPVYFSLDPASPNLVASGADIYFSPAGAGFFVPFSFPAAIGLVGMDNVDSLVMWDRVNIGVADAGVDFALFSLAPGSPTLAAIGGSPADIFVTNFAGGFCLFAPAGALGLIGADNVDGLDVMP
ncbi:MAG: hypothetical protein QOH06_2648 [Acidobacteriota bacterium]|nr:hypothetical protein [Acidobacteriota bacterium]